MIAWQEPPPPIRIDTPAQEIAWAAISGGACATVGFGFSHDGLDRRMVVYLDRAAAEGLAVEQAVEPMRAEAVVFEAWFTALLDQIPVDADWSSASVDDVVHAVSSLCVGAAERWPDVVILPGGIPTSEAALKEHLKELWSDRQNVVSR